VKLGEDILVTPIGSNITANLYAAMATNLVLVVTNPAAQTNLLLLDTEKELEVPAR
jgi:phage baseplate assembly protein W